MPDSCCKAKMVDPMKTTAKYGGDKVIMQKEAHMSNLNKSYINVN